MGVRYKKCPFIYEQVARQESIRVLAQPLLVDIVMALAEERRTDTPLPLQPRSLPSSSSADTLTDDHDYVRNKTRSEFSNYW